MENEKVTPKEQQVETDVFREFSVGETNHFKMKNQKESDPKTEEEQLKKPVDTFSDGLKNERSDLDEKTEKLSIFIQSEPFKLLDTESRSLLRKQLGHMLEYIAVLEQRIKILCNTQQ